VGHPGGDREPPSLSEAGRRAAAHCARHNACDHARPLPLGDFWRFTTPSLRRLLEEVFPPGDVTVESFANMLAGVAFLHGVASNELRRDELEPRDPDYEELIARVVKAAT
jgi:hypothetical protein